MDNGSQFSMTLERMPQGGYVVLDGRSDRDSMGGFRGPQFASTSIDDALKFMRDKIKPTEPAEPPKAGMSLQQALDTKYKAQGLA